ncbi:MAG: hypothetical protein AAGL89_14640 [Pseudomonadota bacterium]
MTKTDDSELDAILAQMRAEDAAPSDTLLDRIMADADDVLAGKAANPVAAPQAPLSTGLFKGVMDAIGGWPAFGGLVAATMAGVWIGVAPPDGVTTLASVVLGDTVEVSLFGDEVFGGLETGL